MERSAHHSAGRRTAAALRPARGAARAPGAERLVGEHGRQHDRAADERGAPRMLAHQHPHPDRPEDRLEQREQAELGGRQLPATPPSRAGSRAELHAAHDARGCRGRAPLAANGRREQRRRRRADTMPATSTCGSMSTVAWNLRSTVSCAAKQHDTPSASRLPVSRPASSASARTSRRCRRTRRPSRSTCAAAPAP